MNKPSAQAHSEAASSTSNRLHYLDWLGVIAVLAVFLFHAVHPFDVIDWHIKEELIATPGTPKFIFAMCMWGLVGWTWTLFILAIGKRYLDYTSPRLQYWREAQLAFFVLHQPVIILIAFYVVGWDAGLMPKLLIVVAGSFLFTIGLYEYLIRRVPLLRGLFGMKPAKRAGAAQPQVGPGEGRELAGQPDRHSST